MAGVRRRRGGRRTSRRSSNRWGRRPQGVRPNVLYRGNDPTINVATTVAGAVGSGVPTASLRQRAPVRPRAARPDRHYASFIVADGDNIQWMLNDLQSSPNWFASPRRGTFDLGWGVSPSMIDLAPSVLNWYYTHAAKGEHNDRFVVGPSGGAYIYPSQYPRDELMLHTERLAAAMTRADLGVVQIIDFDAFDDTDLRATYLRHDQITGLVYLEYSRYDGLRGRVRWARGKPIVSARTMLWDGLSSPDEVIATLNSAPADPTSPEGYSVVMMHAWSMTLDDIGYVVDNLAPHVSVVTPDALVALMTRHASHQARSSLSGVRPEARLSAQGAGRPRLPRRDRGYDRHPSPF